jgi:hypothetical protein
MTLEFNAPFRAKLNAFSACVFSRSLTVAVLYRARKQAVPEHQSRKCCNNNDSLFERM